MQNLQLTHLHNWFDTLQKTYWEKTLHSVYGAGCIDNPKICLMFMNPTARNISCLPDRTWIRAPRIWFKQTRKMIYELWFLSPVMFAKTQWSTSQRTPQFVEELYTHLANQWIYITNLAKCTQADAKALPDSVFKQYLPSIYEELQQLNPQKVITFWNQVSSILLQKAVNVSWYNSEEYETLVISDKRYTIYPCRYPVGMWYRNIGKAKERIQAIL